MATAPRSGSRSSASFAKWDAPSSSWRTCLPLFGTWGTYSARWPTSGSMRSGVCFEHPMSRRRTSGSGSFSWPTPMIINRTSNKAQTGRPTAGPSRGGPSYGLEDVMRLWPTPAAADADRASETYCRGVGNPTLLGAARMWPTPTVTSQAQTAEDPTAKQTGGTTLRGAAERRWTTPTASDAIGTTAGTATHYTGGPSRSLRQDARRWGPPTARDWKDTPSRAPENSLLGRQVLTRPARGAVSSPATRRSPPRLNPRFVEWLMGLPRGWTAFAPLGTPSCPNRPPSRGASYGTDSMPSEGQP